MTSAGTDRSKLYSAINQASTPGAVVRCESEKSVSSKRKEKKNPFRVPDDSEIFALHNAERQRKLQERRDNAAKPIHEKHTHTTKIITRKMANVHETAPTDTATSQVFVQDHEMRKEKESIAQFLEKKRDMFKVQMLLETKKEEIKNLERIARQREVEISRREKELDADRVLFDEFLKDNDNRAAHAARLQEQETKAKNDKMQEIKRVQNNIDNLNKEIRKHDDELKDCRQYKEFLDKLTSPEWLENHEKLRQEKRKAALEEKTRAVMDAWAGRGVTKAADDAGTISNGIKDSGALGAGKKPPGKSHHPQRPPSPSSITLDDEEEILIEEELQKTMYFTEPQQLLGLLKELEDSNLFLIQTSQETTEQLEELRHCFTSTESHMSGEVSSLNSQLVSLNKDIEHERATGERLRELASKTESFCDQEEFLDRIKKKVLGVYQKCGFDNDTKATAGDDVMQMLANIERQMEQYLKEYNDIIGGLSKEEEKQAEREMKAKERARHDAQVKELAKLQQEKEKERMDKALATALAPVQKKFGKPIMSRSNPPVMRRHKKAEKEDTVVQEKSFYS